MKCFVSELGVSMFLLFDRKSSERRTVSDEAAEVTSHDAMPSRAFTLVELINW